MLICDLIKQDGEATGSNKGNSKTKGRLPSRTLVQWTKNQELIFEDLLNHLVKAPVMAHPNFTKSFILRTVASEKGLRVVLYQRQHGETRAIAYAS